MSAQTESWPRPHLAHGPRLLPHGRGRPAVSRRSHGVDRRGDRRHCRRSAACTRPWSRCLPGGCCVPSTIQWKYVFNCPCVSCRAPSPNPTSRSSGHTPDAYRNGHPTGKDILLLIEVSESTLRYQISSSQDAPVRNAPCARVLGRRISSAAASFATGLPAAPSTGSCDDVVSGALPLPTSRRARSASPSRSRAGRAQARHLCRRRATLQ